MGCRPRGTHPRPVDPTHRQSARSGGAVRCVRSGSCLCTSMVRP